MGSATIVVDLGFGDAGKGGIVDFLTRDRRASLVVRFNGGAQAAHRVVLRDGREHIFSQFGSGTLAGASTFLSRHMLVNPIFMRAEARHLAELGIADPLSTVTVDPDALVTTPYHVSANRLRAETLAHGSCGMGIGETVTYAMRFPEEAIRVRDLLGDAQALRDKLFVVRSILRFESFGKADNPDLSNPDARVFEDETLVDRLVSEYTGWTERVRIADASVVLDALNTGDVIFEGAQGVLLDEDYGFHPHTTWSRCTFANADLVLDGIGFEGERRRIGVTRAYATRHGAGPFPTECLDLPDACNTDGGWQGRFRSGWLDMRLLGYAARACGRLDGVAVTCLDRLEGRQRKVGVSYEGASAPLPLPRFLEEQEALGRQLFSAKPLYEDVSEIGLLWKIQDAARAPAVILSRGPAAGDKTCL